MNSIVRRIPNFISQRAFSAAVATTAPLKFKPKSFREAWLGDSGAYPVIGTILFGLFFTTSVTVWSSFSNADARWSDSSRKSLFRGEMAREYQHPPKPSHY